MWLRKEQGNCSIGPYTWDHDGAVVFVDDPVMAEDLLLARNDITEAQGPKAGESTEDGPAPFSFLPDPGTPKDPEDFTWQVPDGTAAEILSWVNGDPQRIQAALEAERARGVDARSTLVAKLEKLAE